MRIRMLTTYIGEHGTALPDEIIEMPRDVAMRYIATQQAEPVDVAPPLEAATIGPAQSNAMREHRPQLKRR